jgi:hypothetical protein
MFRTWLGSPVPILIVSLSWKATGSRSVPFCASESAGDHVSAVAIWLAVFAGNQPG